MFPYDVFPPASKVDNGDNDGELIPEFVPPQQANKMVVTCVKVWIGNGACNRENNKEECNWDGGDCCRRTCLINCMKRKADPKVNNCQFECGTFKGYECK